ncbi:YitT family protein [Brevibacillus sp. B_LB10_24]|uniref:YitT family protein n=1 Tax=Brevibacillus sp. B_LB10_24 TaxID=3380645 RepID=UPI0038B8B7A9
MSFVGRLATLLFSAVLIGTGVNLFLIPQQLVDGGVVGIGLLGKYYFGWSPGIVMFLVSIPIYFLIFRFDRTLFFHSFLGTILTSVLVDALAPLRLLGFVPLELAAVTGGTLIGIGTGLMLACKTNSCATDLLAQFLAKRTNIPVAVLIFFEDGIVISCSLGINGVYKTAFSLLTILSVALSTHYFSKFSPKRKPWKVIGPLSAWLKRE